MQKLILISCCLLAFPMLITAQHVTVTNTKMNIAYIGIDNPIEICVANQSVEAIKVNVENGSIEEINGVYIWNPTSTGDAMLVVSVNGNQVAEVKYRVKRVPNPVAKLGNQSSRNITPAEFIAQKGIVADLENFNFDANCEILGYTITFVRKGKDPVDFENKGGNINNNVINIIKTLGSGDTVYFENIKCKTPGDSNARKINSLVFRIV